MTQNFITMMRKHKVLEKDMKLYDAEGVQEMGHMALLFKLKIESFEDQVYEDVREVEKYYYDPFNTDGYEISKVNYCLF
jgi:hypothetical protein